MKTIGILGGMSWESSIEYERLINTEIRRRLGGSTSGDLIIRSYDFGRIEALQASGSWDELEELLVSDARRLEAFGAEVLAIATNTMHVIAPAIEEAAAARLVHIGDVAADAIVAAGLDTIALLGTRYTMEMGFYRDRLAAQGIETLVPTEPDRTEVHRIIYDELVRGVIDERSRDRMLAVIVALEQRGALGVVAGCTEIELLVSPDHVALPYFPTTTLHASAIVDAALT